jgi:hypothetical protein
MNLAYILPIAAILIFFWMHRSKPKQEIHLEPDDMEYCHKHKRWYYPLYGDGCEECLTEAKNEG